MSDIWEYVAGIIGTVTTAFLAWLKFKDRHPKDTKIYNTMDVSLKVDEILSTITRAFPDVVVSSVGSVTNSDMPTNLQILNSSDHDTFQVWSDKMPMEHELRKVHAQMMIKGDDHIPAGAFKNQLTIDWCEMHEIKHVYVFNIAVVDLNINEKKERSHLVLYVNSRQIEMKSREFFLYCKARANEIEALYKML